MYSLIKELARRKVMLNKLQFLFHFNSRYVQPLQAFKILKKTTTNNNKKPKI